jgi:hypothetical protein
MVNPNPSAQYTYMHIYLTEVTFIIFNLEWTLLFGNVDVQRKKMVGTIRTCFYAIWHNFYEFYEIQEHFSNNDQYFNGRVVFGFLLFVSEIHFFCPSKI